jgi:hypothetical protein
MRAAEPRARPSAPRASRLALIGVAVVTVLVGGLAGCTSSTGADPGTGTGSGYAGGPPPGSAGPGPTPADDTPSSGTGGQACPEATGAQLRERTTVGATGLVTLVGGALPCSGVAVWAARFSLDSDPSLDPTPQFGATYTGASQLAVRLPATTGRCTASAVFFTRDAADASAKEAAARTATEVRGELADWPEGSTAVVPGGTILKGRASAVLAATVVGDPTGCSPGNAVSIPLAAVGDCWTALPSTNGTGTPTGTVADGATRFRRTTCGEPHTHEVYWAEGLTTTTYLAAGKPAGLGAAAWARRHAGEVCSEKSTTLELADDVTRADLYLEYLWPGALTYPPATATSWSKAQVVCLARWQDAKASSRHLLHR